MDRQLYIDRILESDNLTDELEDAEAHWLLTWGIEKLNSILANTINADTVGDKTNAIMAVIRKINHIAGKPLPKEIEPLIFDLADLSSLFYQAFDQDRQTNETACLAGAEHMATITTTMEKIIYLTHWGNRQSVNR